MAPFGASRAGLMSVAADDIPDSVVSRPDDTDDTGDDEDAGLFVELKTDWPGLGAEISNRTSGVTRAYLYDWDEENETRSLITDIDISDKSSGDVFAFEDVELDEGEEYLITIDAEGSEYDQGFDLDGDDYPYESEDIDIVARWRRGSRNLNSVHAINNIGNPDGVLND